MTHIFYDTDANLELIQQKRVAVMGYGSQGHAHALNMQDAGCNVVVGLPTGSKSRERAEADGIAVMTPADDPRVVVVAAVAEAAAFPVTIPRPYACACPGALPFAVTTPVAVLPDEPVVPDAVAPDVLTALRSEDVAVPAFGDVVATAVEAGAAVTIEGTLIERFTAPIVVPYDCAICPQPIPLARCCSTPGSVDA